MSAAVTAHQRIGEQAVGDAGDRALSASELRKIAALRLGKAIAS